MKLTYDQEAECEALGNCLGGCMSHEDFLKVLQKINAFDALLSRERYERFGSSHIMRNESQPGKP
jgi:hypothetical protein